MLAPACRPPTDGAPTRHVEVERQAPWSGPFSCSVPDWPGAGTDLPVVRELRARATPRHVVFVADLDLRDAGEYNRDWTIRSEGGQMAMADVVVRAESVLERADRLLPEGRWTRASAAGP